MPVHPETAGFRVKSGEGGEQQSNSGIVLAYFVCWCTAGGREVARSMLGVSLVCSTDADYLSSDMFPCRKTCLGYHENENLSSFGLTIYSGSCSSSVRLNRISWKSKANSSHDIGGKNGEVFSTKGFPRVKGEGEGDAVAHPITMASRKAVRRLLVITHHTSTSGSKLFT